LSKDAPGPGTGTFFGWGLRTGGPQAPGVGFQSVPKPVLYFGLQ